MSYGLKTCLRPMSAVREVDDKDFSAPTRHYNLAKRVVVGLGNTIRMAGIIQIMDPAEDRYRNRFWN